MDEAPADRNQAARPDFSGAIYGSLLAASVVAGAAAGGSGFDVGPGRLALLLLVTGLVFWLAHVYSRLVGDRIHRVALTRQEIRAVAKHEWPLFQAALPPAAAALLFGVLGASNEAAAWAAVTVAVAGQVGWATVATRRGGASRLLVLVTALVNLALGLLIVVLKGTLHH